MIPQGTLVQFIPPGCRDYEYGMVTSCNEHNATTDVISITPWLAEQNPVPTRYLAGGQCGVVAPHIGEGHFAPDMTTAVGIKYGRVEAVGGGRA